MSDEIQTSELLGKTITHISGAEEGSDEMIITISDGRVYKYYHRQACCESVSINDICGDIKDLLGSPLTMAEEITHEQFNPPEVKIQEFQDSFTWTFYKFATIKGYVTIRWYGASNGYYSEKVSLERIN